RFEDGPGCSGTRHRLQATVRIQVVEGATAAADGCGPAEAPVLDQHLDPGRGGGRWVIRDVERVSAKAARAAGLTAILPTFTAGGRCATGRCRDTRSRATTPMPRSGGTTRSWSSSGRAGSS